MNKLIPIIMLAVMLLMLCVSWKNVISYNEDVKAEYNQHIESAESLMKKEIYIDAVKEYEAALKLQPDNYDIAMTIVSLYEKLEKTGSYAEACQKAIEADPKQKEPYILLTDYYISDSSYRKAYSLLIDAQKQFGNDEDIVSRLVTIKGNYAITTPDRFPVKRIAYPDKSKTGYMTIESDGKYGLADSGNTTVINCEYDDIGLLSNDLVSVKKNGEYYYVDSEGYRKLVPDQPADYLGTFGSGYAPASFDGKYGYVDEKLKQYHMEYDFAGCFAKDVAPVQKDGKWAIIDDSFENITDYVFDEILMDDYNYCSSYGAFFAKQNGMYALYSLDGKKISDDFEDARIFESKEPAAVKKDGKWGFVSIDGKIAVNPCYDDAGSFCIGYAPALIKGKWGAVDLSGNVLIEPAFEKFDSFMPNGYALVEKDSIKEFIAVNIYE